MPTTSHPPRRSSGRDGNTPRNGPLKSFRLTVTVFGAGARELARLAREKGMVVEEEGGNISLVISAAGPEDALEQLGTFSGILASRT